MCYGKGMERHQKGNHTLFHYAEIITICVLANVFQTLHTHIQTCEHLSACTHTRTHKYILFEFLTPILSPEFSPLRPGLILPDDSKGGHLTQSELMRAQGLLCHGFEDEGWRVWSKVWRCSRCHATSVRAPVWVCS